MTTRVASRAATPRVLTPAQVRECANRIHEAERDRRQIAQLSRDFPGMTIDDAYAVQRAWVDMKIAAGRRLVGHKIGLTSRAMQMSSQIDEPDFAPLMSDMVFNSGGDTSSGGGSQAQAQAQAGQQGRERADGNGQGRQQRQDDGQASMAERWVGNGGTDDAAAGTERSRTGHVYM